MELRLSCTNPPGDFFKIFADNPLTYAVNFLVRGHFSISQKGRGYL